jgi:hypothetical protein
MAIVRSVCSFCFISPEYQIFLSAQAYSTNTYLFSESSFEQFRALSDQFYRTPEHHRFVRQQVMKQVRFVKITTFISLSLQ